jgi:diketogulonate reductase-like aldo/keto reductase
MKYREFARTGFKSSVIGMGTYYDFGWILTASLFRKRLNEQGILKSLNTGLDSGINLVDTAEIYASEPIVAKAIKGRDRESIFIATKAFPTHYRREKLIRACEKSLRRLNASYIDLYQLHIPSRRVPIAETMGAMEELVDRGLIRHIGISNFSMSGMLEAEKSLKKYKLTSTQMNYNLSHRQVEKEILPHCEENGIALLAYYPLGHGKLAGNSDGSNTVVMDIARKHGLKSSAQVALTYLLSRSESVFPIPRARTPEHVAENAQLGESSFDKDEISKLQSAFPSADA